MDKHSKLHLLLYVVVIFSIISRSDGATYMVGDTSGWDISTNLEGWTQDKTFQVGDLLVFQYGSSHSVMEVTRENYDKCNTSDVLKTYSNGNTTVALSKPGDRYFVCGNKLHCLGGMKLPVHVAGDKAAASPVGSPQAQPADNSNLPQPSSKTNPSSQNVPNSSGFSINGRSTWDSLVVAGLLGTTMLWIMRQV